MAEKVNKTKSKAKSFLAIFFVLAMIVCTMFVAAACTKSGRSTPADTDDPSQTEQPNGPDEELKQEYRNEYAATTAVGYYAEVTDIYGRVKPVADTKDERAAFDNATMGNVFANDARRYPKYGSTLKHVIGSGEAQQAARSALVGESAYLCAWGTRGANRGGTQTPDKYTKMDSRGYLYQYKNNEWIHSLVWGKTEADYSPENYRQLYKHTAADGMYLEGYTSSGVTYAVADDAPRVVKKVTMRSRGYSSYGITGLYAPAGEVIKIEISGNDMEATGGIDVHIGQALYNGQANNIWVGKNQMQRMPHVLTTFALNKDTCEYDAKTNTWVGYVGSFLGGPIYIRNAGTTFTAEVSGGVEYLHYILGYTTKEEFERLKKESKVPYFDLEVWNYGVLLSGPRYYAEGFSFDNIYNVAVLWEKVSSVTTTNGSKQGIVFIFDPFVAAGAAVAFPGRSSVNCPSGWMKDALNYNGLVSSGSWGNFHEYHHNFQNYGLGSGADGEVTNNALNLVSYSLFTKISSKRGIGTYGAAGLGGWNNYTSATWTLQRVNARQITSTNGLAVYATLLHNFGQDAFIKARGKSGKNNYLNGWANVTHHDFTYYASLIGDYGGGTYTPSDAVRNANYPMFVPVSCVYQTGRSYTYDGEKKYVKTMQPYVIPNAPFYIDLGAYSAPGGQYASGSIVTPEGFTYTVKNVTKPANGTIEVIDDYRLKYTPAAGARTGSTSGQIIVTLGIKKDDRAFEVEDVDLVLEFQISQEVNKMTLTRTTYTYSAENMYTDAQDAFEHNFEGGTFQSKDHKNFTQNVNTDIWYRADTQKNHNDYPNDPDSNFAHDNTIDVVDGKLYFEADGKYRVYLRGRLNCALYYSLDGEKYSLGATIKDTTAPNKSHLFRDGHPTASANSADSYFDVQFDEGKVYINGSDTPVYTLSAGPNKQTENWLYIKEIMIVENFGNSCSFIGVGMRQWTQTMFTVEETYHKADNTAVESPDDDGYAYTKTTYRDYNGREVAYSRREKDSDVVQYFKKSGNIFVASNEQEVSDLTESKLIAPTVTENSQPYVNAYRVDYNFPDNSQFQADYFYKRTYNLSYTGTPVENFTWNDGVQILSCNKRAWDNTTTIDNLLKEGQTTFFHSHNNDKYTTGAMVLELDMGKVLSANRIIFYGRKPQAATLEQQGLPKNFSLEVSTDGENYTDAGEYTNSTGAAYSASVNLNGTYVFRYVRLTVKNTHSKTGHFILSGINFTYIFSLTGNGANHVTPDDDIFTYRGDWKLEQMFSTFGHVYHGKEGSEISFEFTGTRLTVITPVSYDNNFEVWIDGNKVDSVAVTKPASGYGITYISQLLADGKHKVEIKCTGDTYIDSYALF